MAVTLKEIEGTPAAWPDMTRYPRAAMWEDDMPDAHDPVVAPAVVWRMIERWITTRWRSRSVVYTVEGPGQWEARLSPFTVTATDRWTGAGWEGTTLPPSPLDGFELDDGTYRITGTAGDTSDVPDDVQEAWRRLHSFLLGNASEHLDMLATFKTEGDQGGERPRAYAAQALRLSGAGDLLRPYRRLT